MTLEREQWKQLTEKLADPDFKVRLAALEEAGTHDEIQAIRILLTAITDNSNQIRERAGELLLQKQHPATVAGLIAHLDSEKFHVRQTVSELLSKLPAEQVFPQIDALMHDDSLEPVLRLNLIPLYVRHAGSDSIEAVESLIQSSDAKTRVAAVNGLCQVEDDWVIPLLLKLLESRDPETVDKVSASLQRRTGSMVRSGLAEKMSNSGASGDRAVAILTRICGPEEVDLFIEMLHDSNQTVRNRTFKLVSAIAPDRIIPDAIAFLNESDEILSEKAADFLIHRPWESIRDPIRQLLAENTRDSERLINCVLRQRPVRELLDLAEEPGLTGQMIPMIRDQGPEAVKDLFQQSLKFSDSNRDRSRIQLLARMGWPDSVAWLKSGDVPPAEKPFVEMMIAETRFREQLNHAGIHHEAISVEEIESQGRRKGWESGASLRDLLLKTDSLSSLGQRRSDLLDEVRRQEKAVIKVEPMLAKISKSMDTAARRHRWRWVFMGLSGTGIVGAAVCMYMNWQPVSHGLWYFGLVIFTVVAGTGIFGLRQISRKGSADGLTGDLHIRRADLQKKLDTARASLESAQKELDDLESALGSGDTSVAAKTITDLISFLRE
ncbi:MAG TPA: hypothetical protein PLV45_03835 [bacterium]|nr:hypothetical protein [bacterium]